MKRRNKCVDDHLIALNKLCGQIQDNILKVSRRVNKKISGKGLSFNEVYEYLKNGMCIKRKKNKIIITPQDYNNEDLRFSVKAINAKDWIVLD